MRLWTYIHRMLVIVGTSLIQLDGLVLDALGLEHGLCSLAEGAVGLAKHHHRILVDAGVDQGLCVLGKDADEGEGEEEEGKEDLEEARHWFWREMK